MLEKVPFANPVCVLPAGEKQENVLAVDVWRAPPRPHSRLKCVITSTFQSRCSAHDGDRCAFVWAGRCVNAFDKCSFFIQLFYMQEMHRVSRSFLLFLNHVANGCKARRQSLRPFGQYCCTVSGQGGGFLLLPPPSV